MKNFKRLFVAILCIVLVLCSVPFTAFAESTEIVVPEMTNNYNVIDSRLGVNASRYEVKAGAQLFNSTNGSFEAMDASKAEYVEFDIYVTAETTNYIWFWMVSNENVASVTNNDDFNGGAWKIPAGLDIGWNHVALDITSCTRTRGDYDKTNFTDFRAIALEGVPVTSEMYDIVVANVAVTTSVEPPPKFESENIVIDVAEEMHVNAPNLKAGAILWNYYNDTFSAMDASKADYLEVDIYVSAPTENYMWFWMASNENIKEITNNDDINGGAWKIPAGLEIGWNHVVIDITSCTRTRGDYNKETFELDDFPFFVFHTAAECRQMLLTGGIHILHEVASDGASELLADQINAMNDEDYAQYLRYHAYLCEKPEFFGMSNHLLFVGEK